MKSILVFAVICIAVTAKAQQIEIRKDSVISTKHERPFQLKLNPPLFFLGEVEINEKLMSEIKPESIDAITVLKDSAATEKYGERAKFGVVLIELKKPRFNIIKE
jgi:hypothetical protein